MNARGRLTANGASHEQVRRFRQERDAANWVKVLLSKTCRDNLPSLVFFYGMRSLHKFVITAGLLCHLFLIVPLVTSQARAEQAMQNSAASEAQATPSPTPAAQPQQTPPKRQDGSCHLIITSQPALHSTQPSPARNPSRQKPQPQHRLRARLDCRSAKKRLSPSMPMNATKLVMFTRCCAM